MILTGQGYQWGGDWDEFQDRYIVCADSGCYAETEQDVESKDNGNSITNHEIRSDYDNNISGYFDHTLVGLLLSNIGGSLSTINQIALSSPYAPVHTAPSALTLSLPNVSAYKPFVLSSQEKKDICVAASILRSSSTGFGSFGADSPSYSLDHNYYGLPGASRSSANGAQSVAAILSFGADYLTCRSLLN